MTRQRALLALLALVCLAALGFLIAQNFERVDHSVDLPSRGEARYNPLYGLGKALSIAGYRVASRATLDLPAMALAPDDTLLLGTEIRSIGADDADALRTWVMGGGHLVFALPASGTEQHVPLLQQFGIMLMDGEHCVGWRSTADGDAAELCSQVRISWFHEEGTSWSWPTADDDGYLAVRARAGDGSWLALPHLRFLRARELKNADHAALAWHLLEPMLGRGRVHIVYATDLPPAYVALVRYGWPVWIPALLALLAWLWRRSQRLGPVLPLPQPDRRALLEHVRAAGEFAFRRQRGEALHATLKRRFEAQLARSHPTLAALEGEAQLQGIAQLWQLDIDAVRTALAPTDLRRPDPFLAAIRSLSRLQTPP
jgi:hypothetical protein